MYNPSLDKVDTFDGSWDKAEMLEWTKARAGSASKWKIENSAGMQVGDRRCSNEQSKLRYQELEHGTSRQTNDGLGNTR